MLNRRKFVVLGLIATPALIACQGVYQQSPLRGTEDEEPATVLMQDLNIVALYSDGNFGPMTGVLKAQDIKAGKKAKFDHWDGHGHTFEVKRSHYLDLLAGKKVRIETTEALDHTHIVLLDPNIVVEDSAAVKIKVIPDWEAENVETAAQSIPGNAG